MFGLGTMINTGAVIAGGLFGLLFGKGLTKRFQDILMSATGICIIFMGASSTFQEMLTIVDGKITAGGTIMLVVSLCLGALVGEWINIERRTEQLGEWLKAKTGSKEATFVDGFVTTSLTICVGAMAVLGPIEDGLNGNYSILLMKSILDAIIVVIMTAASGVGCIFSALPILVIEGGITILATFLAPIMTPAALSNLSLVGSVMITCVGINLVFEKKFRVANMLPALVFAVGYAFI